VYILSFLYFYLAANPNIFENAFEIKLAG